VQRTHALAVTFGSRDRLLCVYLTQHHHELFTSVTPADVGPPATLLQRNSDLAKHDIADLMSVRVVDAFEVVDVDEQHRERSRGRVFGLYCFLERAPAERPRQRIFGCARTQLVTLVAQPHHGVPITAVAELNVDA